MRQIIRSDQDTRARVLESATQLFATRGYGGTSVRDITTAARANLAAVTYHFGAKEGLYNEVLLNQMGPLKRRILWVHHMDVPPLEKVERMVRAFFEHIREHPAMPALMIRELASGREIHGTILQILGEILPMITGAVEAGQADGTIRSGDPKLLAFSTVAQPVHLNIARPVIAKIAGIDPRDPALAAAIAEHVVTTVRRAIENR